MARRFHTVAIAAGIVLVAAESPAPMINWTNYLCEGTNTVLTNVINWSTSGTNAMMVPFGLITSNHYNALVLATRERIGALCNDDVFDYPSMVTDHVGTNLDEWLWCVGLNTNSYPGTSRPWEIGNFEAHYTNDIGPLSFDNQWWYALTKVIEALSCYYIGWDSDNWPDSIFSADGTQSDAGWNYTTNEWTRIPARHATNGVKVVGYPTTNDVCVYEWFYDRYVALKRMVYTIPRDLPEDEDGVFPQVGDVETMLWTNALGAGGSIFLGGQGDEIGTNASAWTAAKSEAEGDWPSGGTLSYIGTYGKLRLTPASTNDAATNTYWFVQHRTDADATKEGYSAKTLEMYTSALYEVAFYLQFSNVPDGVYSNAVYDDQSTLSFAEGAYTYVGTLPKTNARNYEGTIYSHNINFPSWCTEPTLGVGVTNGEWTEFRGCVLPDAQTTWPTDGLWNGIRAGIKWDFDFD